ncbi:hypothetical protein HDU91_003752 [Kappamyces sp. JEL0680]|nr:hypothetical protein HDU91_003752 [Kappamyces sp. JEL0680]
MSSNLLPQRRISFKDVVAGRESSARARSTPSFLDSSPLAKSASSTAINNQNTVSNVLASRRKGSASSVSRASSQHAFHRVYDGEGGFQKTLSVSGSSISSRPSSGAVSSSRKIVPEHKTRIHKLGNSLDSITIDSCKKDMRRIVSKDATELPPWNASTKPLAPFPNPKSQEVLQQNSVSSRSSKTGHKLPESIPSATLEEAVLPEVEAPLLGSLPKYSRQYPPSPYQFEICSTLLPGSEDEQHSIDYSDFTITQSYGVTEKLDGEAVALVVAKLVSEYPVLATKIVRNPKIIDADIECFIDDTAAGTSRYVATTRLNKSSQALPMNQLIEVVSEWKAQVDPGSPFQILLVDGVVGDLRQFVVFGGSVTILDEASLLWIGKRFFTLYETYSTAPEAVSKYVCEEAFSFEDFSFQSIRTNSDLAFWRKQCIEVTQDYIDPLEKQSLEKKLKALAKETLNLQRSLKTATKRRSDYEKELNALRKQRLEIDHSMHASNEKPTYMEDPSTGEKIEMSSTAKAALIKTVLGSEVIEDNVVPLLEKHEVSVEVQRKINAHTMTLQDFAATSEATIDQLSLLPKDRRQILALADYTRNRIKECIQELGKVKFGLERQIAKAARNLETAVENINSTRESIDANEDMSFRLTGIIHPPLVEKTISPITAKNMEDNLGEKPTADVSLNWGMINFEIGKETMDNLRTFRSDWTNNIKNKRKMADIADSSDNESLLESDDEHDSLPTRTEKKLRDKSVGAVCLAAFGVLMKHITGSDNFLVGLTTSFRAPGLVVGPLTDTMPVKLDLSKKDLSFSSLFSSIHKVFKHIQRHGKSCPRSYISKKLQLPLEFPIEFQFVSKNEARDWESRGFSMHDILKPHEQRQEQFGTLQTERIWSSNPQDAYDIKFIMVEYDDHLDCGVRYRRDKFEEGRILRWVAKFQSTLDGIDCSRRKLSVTSMITR